MVFKKFIKISTAPNLPITSSDLNRVQDSIQDSLQPIIQKIQLDSEVQQSISLTQGIVNKIPHKINRIPIIFKYIGYAQADVWHFQAADNNFLYLMCSSDVVIDFEVS
jgi:hypothetical protein